MDTPPDGISPRMQMYLFHQPGTIYPDEDPFIASNGGDEADVVYHEYTHGLSNRLVIDANGDSTLGPVQAGAMGEAWSDWYAMDYLVGQGLFKDTSADGDLRVGQYVGAGLDLIRTEPMDCKVGSTSATVPGHGRRRAWRLHLRRLRQDRRRSRGARRRRDLGPDAVGPARRAGPEPHRVPRHACDVAVAQQPVDARRAGRDPAGRRDAARRTSPRHDLERLRTPWHGLLRRIC